MAHMCASTFIYLQFPLAKYLRRYLDEIRGLGYLAMPNICAIDEKQPVVRFDPAVQGGDGVLQDFHNEYSGFRAAPRDPTGVSGVWEETEVKGEKKLFLTMVRENVEI